MRPCGGKTGHDRGATVWFTGLSGAGKSTVADAVAAALKEAGRNVELLDGDLVRAELTEDLGFSREDRDRNVARIGFTARLLARHGVVVLVPVIAPFREARDDVRARHRVEHLVFREVFVATSLRVCASRDAKGLYARQRAGTLRGLTGVDDPYEVPLEPDVRIDTECQSVDECRAAVLRCLDSGSDGNHPHHHEGAPGHEHS